LVAVRAVSNVLSVKFWREEAEHRIVYLGLPCGVGIVAVRLHRLHQFLELRIIDQGRAGWSLIGLARVRVTLEPGYGIPPNELDPHRMTTTDCRGECNARTVGANDGHSRLPTAAAVALLDGMG